MTRKEALAVFEGAPHIAPLLPQDLRTLVEAMLRLDRSERLGRAIDVFRHPVFVQKFRKDVRTLRAAFIRATFPDFPRQLMVFRGSYYNCEFPGQLDCFHSKLHEMFIR